MEKAEELAFTLDEKTQSVSPDSLTFLGNILYTVV